MPGAPGDGGSAATLDLLRNPTRQLPVTDADARQLTISCGARIALAAARRRVTVTRFPDPAQYVSRVRADAGREHRGVRVRDHGADCPPQTGLKPLAPAEPRTEAKDGPLEET